MTPQLVPRPRRQPLRTRPAFVATSSALLGFVTGAVFWHSIGFWSFVSTVVLKGTDEDNAAHIREAQAVSSQVASNQAAPKLPVHLRPTGSIGSASVGPIRPTGGSKSGAAKSYQMCSLAVPDDASGEAHVLPCPAGTLAAPTKPLARKGDLLTAGPPELAISQAQAGLPAAPAVGAPSAVPAAAVARREPALPQSWAPVIRGAQR